MAMQALFTTDIGLLSVFTIGFVVVMAWYLVRFVTRHMKEDEQLHGHYVQIRAGIDVAGIKGPVW